LTKKLKTYSSLYPLRWITIRKVAPPPFGILDVLVGGLLRGKESRMDELKYIEAVDIVAKTQHVGVTKLQRSLSLGYVKVMDIIDRMESEGYIGEYIGSKPRKIFIQHTD
jgi:DNA segregation ATPase FtsK/SpoIIIE-like protein